MVGKDPHRPEGKTSDAERMSTVTSAKEMSRVAPSAAQVARTNEEQMQKHGSQLHEHRDEQIGGSRPGVESRVKEALDRVEGRG